MAGWKSVEEIEAYRLGVTLRDEIIRMTDSGPVARDFKFKEQIRESSSSVPRNLAEGFERYVHGEFWHFATIAKGSAGETVVSLDDARVRGYLTVEQFASLHALAVRVRNITGGLVRYLRNSNAPGENSRPRRRARR